MRTGRTRLMGLMGLIVLAANGQAQTVRDVTTGTNGVLVSPANLWSANAADIAAALSLGNAATRNIGTTTGTVAAGNDARITGAAQRTGDNTFKGNQSVTGNFVITQNRTNMAALELVTPFNQYNNTNHIKLRNPADGLGWIWVIYNEPGYPLAFNYQTIGTTPLWLYNTGVVKVTGELQATHSNVKAPNATSTASDRLANVGTLDARYEPKKLYAVFDIPLGGAYTDFELKASASNFRDGMAFFYHSPDPGKSVITEQIWTTRPDVYFTDSAYVGTDTDQNQRTWRKQSASQSIATMRAGGSNSVIAGAVVVVRDTGTISPTNTALVWSYCRYTPTAYEADGSGRSIWMPISPKWVTTPPAPTAAVP